MSFITAIKSFVTPTKYYRNTKVSVSKKLQKDGSWHIQSFNRDGNLVKDILRVPVDILQYDPKKGNVLTYGHVTTVKDLVAGTKTVINRVEKRFEKAIPNALSPKENFVDAGGSIYYFHKFKTKGNTYVDSFNMKSQNGVKSCVKFRYDEFGHPNGVKMYKVSPKEVK